MPAVWFNWHYSVSNVEMTHKIRQIVEQYHHSIIQLKPAIYMYLDISPVILIEVINDVTWYKTIDSLKIYRFVNQHLICF